MNERYRSTQRTEATITVIIAAAPSASQMPEVYGFSAALRS